MNAVLVLSQGGLALKVVQSALHGRIGIETNLFSLSMTVEEARELATRLQNAAVQATPMVELEDAA